MDDLLTVRKDFTERSIMTELGLLSPSLKAWAENFIENHGDFEDMVAILKMSAEMIATHGK